MNVYDLEKEREKRKVDSLLKTWFDLMPRRPQINESGFHDKSNRMSFITSSTNKSHST